MPTDVPPEQEAQAQHLHNMKSSIEALNARIARLAIGLGVSLGSEAEIAHVMSQKNPASPVAHDRRSGADGVDASHLGANPDRRVAHKLEELRGLLVLRYGVERRFVDDVGAVATRKILSAAEAHLEREGFKPRADGIDLERLFKES